MVKLNMGTLWHIGIAGIELPAYRIAPAFC